MAGRRDLYQGYRFMLRRQAGALLRSDPDTADGTLRRLSTGAAGSVTLAAVGIALALLAGLFSPAASAASWQNGRTLIVDAQTGTRYVYLGGELHPVLNYASALLILRNGAVAATSVPDAQLAGVAHGAPVGIPGAPEMLPSAAKAAPRTWSVCSVPATTPAGNPWSLVQVSLGTPLPGNAVGPGSGVLVEDPSGDEYLVWNGTRLAVPGGAGYVLAVLGASSAPATTVGDAWLDAVPQGPALAAPNVSGQVVKVTATGAYYVQAPDGLAPVTALQAQLLMARADQASPAPISVAQAASAGRSAQDPAAEPGLPQTAPKTVAGPGGGLRICAGFDTSATQSVPTVTTEPQAPQQLSAAPTVPVDALGAPVADSVLVPAGGGAVLQAVPGPGVSTGTRYLVTDLGVKYPLDGSVLSDLGLGSAPVARIPQAVVAVIPTGPDLSESAALATQPTDPGTATSAASPLPSQ